MLPLQAALIFAAFLLCGVLLILIIVSAGDPQKNAKPNQPRAIKLIGGASSDYVIVCPENASRTVLEAAERLRAAIRESTGASLPIITDSPEEPPAPHEILVGHTCRDYSVDALEMLNGRAYYAAIKSGGTLVLTGTDDEMVAAAVDSFVAEFVLGSKTVSVPAGYGEIVHAPEIVSPARGEENVTISPVFTFTAGSAGEHTIEVHQPDGKGWTPVATWKISAQAGETVRHFDDSKQLEPCSLYLWRVGCGAAYSAGVFSTVYDKTLHPANTGLVFAFSDMMPEKVLHAYLSRAVSHSFFERTDEEFIKHNRRFILNVGAKFVLRAASLWRAGASDEAALREYAKAINDMHTADPDIIFEAYIPEAVSPSVGEFAVPAWVFKAFGIKPENRPFSYEAMLFPEGEFVGHWGDAGSVPDIRQTETQMWYYYRAATLIDAGFEALYFGQLLLPGKHDGRNAGWTRVFSLIREYASKYARRRFVLLSGQTHGIVGSDGKLLCDFHRYGARCMVPETEADHPPTEDDPQKVIFSRGYGDSIFGRSIGGRTYSGWAADSLPYIIELDSCGFDTPAGTLPKHTDIASADWWGYDEMSWFANQPYWYQRVFLAYAYRWVIEADRGGGHFAMPGTRQVALRGGDGLVKSVFYPFSSVYFEGGTDVENIIREIWTSDNKKTLTERF
ncbi:MAG TPA: hypothetical protein GXX22_03105 [Clostridiales bacterium]|nr:hypothetical protein [Clostridiales bacterium]